MRHVTSLSSLHKWWNWGTEMLSNLPKATQPARGSQDPSTRQLALGLCPWCSCLLQTCGGSVLCYGWMGTRAAKQGGKKEGGAPFHRLWGSCSLLGQRDEDYALAKSIWASIPLLRVYPIEQKTCVHTETCTWMFTAALFMMATKWTKS